MMFEGLNLEASAVDALISHQPTVLLSQNKPAISNQSTLLFYTKRPKRPAPAISHLTIHLILSSVNGGG
jgi:hypothetical protein